MSELADFAATVSVHQLTILSTRRSIPRCSRSVKNGLDVYVVLWPQWRS